jgi:hypothetical protein
MKRSQVFGSAEVREEKLTPNEHPLISKIARACKNRVRWVSRIALKNKKTAPSLYEIRRRKKYK